MLDEEALTLRYEYKFHSKLAQAYHSKGINEKNKEAAQPFFNKAIEHYQDLLDIDGYEREEILLKLAEISADLGETSESMEYFDTIIGDYPDSIRAYIKKVNLLLDIEQNKLESDRNYSEAKRVYEIASKLSNIENDDEFAKLKRRMKNIGLL